MSGHSKHFRKSIARAGRYDVVSRFSFDYLIYGFRFWQWGKTKRYGCLRKDTILIIRQ